MKKIVLSLLLLSGVTAVTAQETNTSAKPFNNQELGLFGQTEGNGNPHYMSMVGIQYKHYHNEHLGYRLIGAFGQYRADGTELEYITGDTSFTRQERLNINLPIAGIGIEAQRHFYKRVYLFAALELKGGYGKGDADTIFRKSTGLVQPGSQSNEIIGHYDASLLYIGMTASVGAKLQYNKVGMSLEILPIQAAYTRVAGNNYSHNLMDMNIGSFSQRLSLYLRF